MQGRRRGRFKPTKTYIETAEGWMYLAGIVDAFTRRIVGWACAPHMETSLVLRALETPSPRVGPPRD